MEAIRKVFRSLGQILLGAATLAITLRAQARHLIPITPPDTDPVSLYDDTNVVVNSPILGPRAVKNTILVLFTANATQTQRQFAIDLVHGVVVGGNQFLPNHDGNYLIRVPYDASGARLASAISRLDTVPQVDYVGTLDLSESNQTAGLPLGTVNARHGSAASRNSLLSAGEIPGVVLFARSGLPAGGASVAARNRTNRHLISVVLSDRHGRFHFAGLPGDSILVSTHLIGYYEEIVGVDARSGSVVQVGLRQNPSVCTSVCVR